MFNESNSSINPNAFITGFNIMTAEELFKFIESNGFSFTRDQIVYIQNYFKNKRKIFPTYNQLAFFDKINGIRQSQKKGYSIYSVSASKDAEPILESSRDLIAKRDALNMKVLGAMPISFAAEIASAYFTDIGYNEGPKYFIPANSCSEQEYYIHTENNVPLFVYSDPIVKNPQQKSKEVEHNILAMLCPQKDIEHNEYLTQVKELFSIPEIASATSDAFTVEAPFGLFDILLNKTNGASVNLANLPEIEKNEEGKAIHLSPLLNSCIGRQVFSTTSKNLQAINKIAEEYSLCAYVFAIKNNSQCITLDANRNPIFSFDFDFLNKLMHFQEPKEYQITSEKNLPLGKRKSVYLSIKKDFTTQTFNAEKTLNFGKIMSCATSRDLNTAPHKTAATSIIDAVNSLIAKGASKNSISLAIHYDLLCNTDSGVELGKNLSAVLGAYRSMVELCVSDSLPQISYNPTSRSIVAVASAKPPKRLIGSSFANGGTYIYLYNIKYEDNELPDYKSYRAFIKYFYSLIERDNIHSAFSINENLSSVLENAAKDTQVDFVKIFNSSDYESMHGILFETKKIIKTDDNIRCIGVTSKK